MGWLVGSEVGSKVGNFDILDGAKDVGNLVKLLLDGTQLEYDIGKDDDGCEVGDCVASSLVGCPVGIPDGIVVRFPLDGIKVVGVVLSNTFMDGVWVVVQGIPVGTSV